MENVFGRYTPKIRVVSGAYSKTHTDKEEIERIISIVNGFVPTLDVKCESAMNSNVWFLSKNSFLVLELTWIMASTVLIFVVLAFCDSTDLRLSLVVVLVFWWRRWVRTDTIAAPK